jgi:hypothetical protein
MTTDSCLLCSTLHSPALSSPICFAGDAITEQHACLRHPAGAHSIECLRPLRASSSERGLISLRPFPS